MNYKKFKGTNGTIYSIPLLPTTSLDWYIPGTFDVFTNRYFPEKETIVNQITGIKTTVPHFVVAIYDYLIGAYIVDLTSFHKSELEILTHKKQIDLFIEWLKNNFNRFYNEQIVINHKFKLNNI